MKLLFDQNLSFKLVSELADVFPDCRHVSELGFESSADDIIWNYVSKNNYVIVSKDSDFHQRSFLFRTPPKVIWVKGGNCSTKTISKILRKANPQIKAFQEDRDATFLVLE